jgi:hypothetical protein
MKLSNLLFVLLWATALTSCSKNRANDEKLSGVWELRASSGGMMPYNVDNYKPGNGSLWAFTQTRFTRTYKDSVYKRGMYSISIGTGTDLNTGRKIDQFIFNNTPSDFFELRGDTLSFYYGAIAYDGEIEKYVKISEDTTAVKY